MTTPYQPQVVRAPDSDVGQGLAPLIQALQFRQHLAEQRAEEEQRVAAQLFAHGLQTPGFENTPAAQALELKLGVPGLGASIGKARTAEESRKTADINTFVEGLSGISDKAKSGLRASLIAGTKGATSEVQNSLYAAMATGEDPGILEQARLQNLYANTAHTLMEIERMKREPTPHDQAKAAQLLGINTGDLMQGGSNAADFVTGTNYISVLEDRLKQKETDPAKVIVNTAISLMTLSKDILGRPNLLPEEAFNNAISLTQNVFPKTAGTFKLTPQTEQVLNATRAATLMWQTLRLDDNAIKEAPSQGYPNGRVLKQLKSNKEIVQYIRNELQVHYPLLMGTDFDALLGTVQRRMTETQF